MPYKRESEIVLAMWREVERVLRTVPPDSERAKDLQAEVTLLREEYQRLVDLAVEHHREVPPPLPETP